jgi:hypothetical protein
MLISTMLQCSTERARDTVFVHRASPISIEHLLAHSRQRGWLPVYLHPWFLAHLLLYSAVFVAWREAIVSAARAGRWSAPGHGTIAGFVLALAPAGHDTRFRNTSSP